MDSISWLSATNVNRSIKKWYDSELKTLGDQMELQYRQRSEVQSGLLIADATAANGIDCSAGSALLNGKLADLALFNEALLIRTGVVDATPATASIQHINIAGANVAAGTVFPVAGDQAKAVIVAIMSDGAGAPGTVVKLMAVLGATVAAAGTPLAPTGYQVEQAIAAATGTNSNLAANGGWVILGEVLVTETTGTYVISAHVDNRSNYLGR